MDMVVRTATRSDMDKLVALYEAISKEVAGTDNDPIWEVGVYPTLDDLRGFIDDGAFYVAVKDGRVAGAMVAKRGGEDGYEKVAWISPVPLDQSVIIHLFGMHPDFKGKGLARPFMRSVEQDLAAKGHRIMRLDVIADNVGAQRVYEKLGFTSCGTTWLEYPDYQGEFAFYEKEL